MRRLDTLAPKIADRVFLAEDFNDWMRSSTYDDLFTFEQDLAALASLILIFVESAGAIAELGAFAAIPQVNEKLLVFLQTPHYQSESFIRLGLLDFLTKNNQASVCNFPWATTQNGNQQVVVKESIDDCIDEIIDSVSLALNRNTPRSFRSDQARDQMLLICDFLDQMIGLQLHEIQEYVALAGIDLEVRTLKQRLYVLGKLNLVELIPRGHTGYYVTRKPLSLIRYRFQPGIARYDRERVRAEIAQHYKEHDRGRIKALAAILTR